MGEVQYHIGQTLDEALAGETERSFSPAEFGYDDLGMVNTVDLTVREDYVSETGKLYVLSASCTEPLMFHRGQFPELFEPFDDPEDDSQVELTEEAYAALVEVFEERYSGVDILGSEDGCLTFDVGVAEERGDFPIDALDEGSLWPILAQIANESDPGTFGSEYVWTEIARVVKAKADAAE